MFILKKLGLLLPLTGQIAHFGQDAKAALDLVFKNEPVEIVLEDSLGTPQGSLQGINRLILNSKVQAIIGDLSTSNTLASSPIAENSHIPMITSATGDTVSKNRKYIFQMSFTDSRQGKTLGSWAATDMKAKTAILLMDKESEYSQNVAESFKKEFLSHSGKISSQLYYTHNQQDVVSLSSKILKLNPDILFIPGFPTEVAPFLKQLQAYKGIILGADGWHSPDLWQMAGNVTGTYYHSSQYFPDESKPIVKAFIKDFKAQMGREPSSFAALSYDSGLYLKQALKSKNCFDIQTCLKNFKDFDGVTGRLNPNKLLLILKVKNKKYEIVAQKN